MSQPNNGETLRSAAQKWVVYEASGRWAAALRVAFARSSEIRVPPRLYEMRTLGELSQACHDNAYDLALIEVRRGSLTDVLQLVIRHGVGTAPFVALLDESGDEPDRQLIADLLWEAGAADVIASPRQLEGLLALHRQMAAVCRLINDGLAETQSFTDWAWSTLPWQDT